MLLFFSPACFFFKERRELFSARVVRIKVCGKSLRDIVSLASSSKKSFCRLKLFVKSIKEGFQFSNREKGMICVMEIVLYVKA